VQAILLTLAFNKSMAIQGQNNENLQVYKKHFVQ